MTLAEIVCTGGIKLLGEVWVKDYSNGVWNWTPVEETHLTPHCGGWATVRVLPKGKTDYVYCNPTNIVYIRIIAKKGE